MLMEFFKSWEVYRSRPSVGNKQSVRIVSFPAGHMRSRPSAGHMRSRPSAGHIYQGNSTDAISVDLVANCIGCTLFLLILTIR